VAAAALEQSVLESKDKDTLLEMAKALGVKASSRLKKSDIIDKILDTTGSSAPVASNKPAASASEGKEIGAPIRAADERARPSDPQACAGEERPVVRECRPHGNCACVGHVC